MDQIIRETFEDNHLEITSKEEEYLAYINEHCEFVKECFRELFLESEERLCGFSKPDALREAIEVVRDTEIETHDHSKYSDEEFNAYRVKFFPTAYEKAHEIPELQKQNFDEAWEHHYLNNSHHTKYWWDANGIPQDMELSAIVHMISDWAAMSKKFGGTVTDWYWNDAEKERREMSDNTRKTVEELLEILF